MYKFLIINFYVFIIKLNNCYIIDFGPSVKATKGEVWPMPQLKQTNSNYFIIQPNNFNFKTKVNGCRDLLWKAIDRYKKIIFNELSMDRRGRYWEFIPHNRNIYHQNDNKYSGYLNQLDIEIIKPCSNDEFLTFNSSEAYSLIINTTDNIILTSTIWGALRGLETFSQLIYLDNGFLKINFTIINDFPRFKHRGLLVDTSRHYIPVYILLENLDAMTYNKLNVFHWHITDDQSFPYSSFYYPALSDKGAYHSISKIYRQSDIKRIIEYARERGIRVIPEFDTPGHTRSWGEAYPTLLTECYKNGNKTGQLGPMDPSNNFTYKFLSSFFQEISNVFPDAYLHLGGDEVEFECWSSNPNLTNFMKKMKINEYNQLESFFIENLIKIIEKLDKNFLVWEEVFNNGVKLPNSTIIHAWKGNDYRVVNQVIESGKFALLSSGWYLDHLEGGGDWKKFYRYEPYNIIRNENNRNKIIGGEACMWTEVVNEYNLISRIWPRASAAAEKLWSNNFNYHWDDVEKRIEEHTCRMNRRGIEAQPPNGPGVCL